MKDPQAACKLVHMETGGAGMIRCRAGPMYAVTFQAAVIYPAVRWGDSGDLLHNILCALVIHRVSHSA